MSSFAVGNPIFLYIFALRNRKGGYQSGQMGQTVNLLAMPSVVRIHHHPQYLQLQIELLLRMAEEVFFILGHF